MEPIRILSIDDHPLMRQGIAAMIRTQPDMLLVAEAQTGAEGVTRFREHRPDIALLDLLLPDMRGIDALIDIRSEFPDARVIMLTTFAGDADIRRALTAGARGYVLKSMPQEELLQSLREVHAGKKWIPPEIATQLAEHMSDQPLSMREIEVLQQVAAGRRNRDIAALLFISEETVKVHVKRIMQKLGARDRTGAVAMAVRRGILHL